MARWSSLQRLALIFTALLSGSLVLGQFCRSDRTTQGNANGARCVFPFLYRNQYYSECTGIDNKGRKWCATTENYDTDERWGNCVCNLASPETVCTEKTVTGKTCARPFFYKGRAFYGCTPNENKGVQWCSLDMVYRGRWERCASLVCPLPGCRVDITEGANGNGASCAIPFTYKGTQYTECIGLDNRGVRWCSVTTNYDRDQRWGRCICDLVTVAPPPSVFCRNQNTVGGNGGGAACVFPFIYRGISYSECTVSENNRRKWCATTSNYDINGRWGNCICDITETPKPTFVPLYCNTDRTTGGNAGGRKCSFPYLYRGAIYNNCIIRDNRNQPWCATTGNYDVDNRWGNCICNQLSTQAPTVDRAPCQTDSTQGGNAGGAACNFPFRYMGDTYYECTAINNNGRRWCATTASYGRDERWGNCVCSDSFRSTPAPPAATGCQFDRTTGGNAGGAACVVPFVYKGDTYTDCLRRNNNNRLWCSTTNNYDINRRWGNCICNGVTPAPTPAGSALTPSTSATSAPCTDRTTDGRPCSVPFTYNGVSYNGCINLGNNGNFWCSLTPDYNRDRQWANCQLPICVVATPAPGVTSNVNGCRGDVTTGGNAGGRACAFPFLYRGVPYSECITLNNNGRKWCAVTGNYDINEAWGNCFCNLPTMATQPVFIGQCRSDVTRGGNSGGAACVFPFIYRGVSYSECTNRDNPQLWCATTSNYDVNNRWGNCICITTATTSATRAPAMTTPNAAPPPVDRNCRVDATTGGNGAGSRCILPFTYLGQQYTSCITLGTNNVPWCAVTANYDRDRLWGNCICDGSNPAPPPGTPGPNTTPTTPGNAGPFTTQTTTTRPSGTTPFRPPSGTTPFRCREQTIDNRECSPMFIYNSVSYSGCITVDYNGKYWCSLDAVYIGNFGDCRLPLRCSSQPPAPNPTPQPQPTQTPAPPPATPQPPPSGQCTVFTDNGQCFFPFSYNGVNYRNCTDTDNGGVLWCSLTRNYNMDGRLGLCTDFSRCRG